MQLRENIITISRENLSAYGFSCFHLPEDPGIIDDFWVREIEMAKGVEVQLQKFKIPKPLLIEISSTKKIIHSEYYKVQSNRSDVSPINLLSERAGWNQTLADLEAMKAHGNSGYQLATFRHENKEIPLGCGLSLPVADDMSWIGMILVHPELRRQGIARSIMNSCIVQARVVQRKSIIGLDATPQGKQVYDDLGFKDSYKIWRSTISTNQEIQLNKSLRTDTLDLKLIKEYLHKKNNTQRIPIVELLDGLPGTFNRMAMCDGKVTGFIMSRPGRLKPFIGPLIADSEATAIHLLNDVLKHWKSIGIVHAFIDIPEYHIGLASIFIHEDDQHDSSKESRFSIKKARSFIRMYQLIAEPEIKKHLQKSMHWRQASMNDESKVALHLAAEGYGKTMTFMEKERNEIILTMYAIGGPEMS